MTGWEPTQTLEDKEQVRVPGIRTRRVCVCVCARTGKKEVCDEVARQIPIWGNWHTHQLCPRIFTLPSLEQLCFQSLTQHTDGSYVVLASGYQRNTKINARGITLIILNCPTDERPGSLDQSCCSNPLLPTDSTHQKLNRHESHCSGSPVKKQIRELVLGRAAEGDLPGTVARGHFLEQQVVPH